MKRILFVCLALVAMHSYGQKTDTQIKQLIAKLTLQEKVFLVIGTGMDIPGMSEKNEIPQSVIGTTKDKVPGAAGTSYTIKSANIPAVVFADGPAGIRISPTRDGSPNQTFYATAFPTATLLASTWNTHMVTQVGNAFGEEGKAYGVDFLLAPALNIHRNPLGGRNFEYYSEDPLVSGAIAAAFVNGVQEKGIGATIKHFVANNSETNRTALNTVVSERALREIYLKGFQIAIEKSHPWAIMSSYNKINGTYASENKELLTHLLRDEWHYKGFVMTDWFGGKDAVAQMKAGNDLLMPGTSQQAKAIKEAVENGTLDEEILNKNIFKILKQYNKTPSFKNLKPTNKPDLAAHKLIAKQAAEEGFVLLKNENQALPLQEKKVALFGVTSYETIAGGTGSGDVNKAYMVSILEGLQNANFALDSNLTNTYTSYIKNEKAKMPAKKFFFEPDILVPEKGWKISEIETLAQQNDVAIFTLGRTSGEFFDRKQENDFTLTPEELQEIKNISEVFHKHHKPFIVILNIGGVIETESWKKYADAILLAWQPGQEAGNAIADVINGKISPSGKLTTTFPIHYEDVSSSQNFPGKLTNPNAKKPQNPLQGIPMEVTYQEGIYVGYRYYETFNIPVSYPFGYGLSYTNFEYDHLKTTTSKDDITFSFTIKNTGKVAGKEVVQLYVSSPKGTIEKPVKELKAFAKTKLLAPNELAKITFTIKKNDLGYFDTNSASWKLDGGDYTFTIASTIDDAKLKVTLPLTEKVIEKVTHLMAPVTPIHELSQNK
ncbi:beta-glucosidase [Zhouia sp. PK063]|uniref:beta-glucosidase n=1 Tax=Zhouia sp. PK063 TaxID=3373602 RepID=UPI0037B7E47C